jgi:hypothetical protein
MKIAKAAKWIAGVSATALGVMLWKNWEEVGQRMGWTTFIADAVVSKDGKLVVPPPSPAVIWMIAAFLVMVGIFAGLWIDSALRAFDKRRAAKRWWEGLEAFSLTNCASLIEGIHPSEFDKSVRAKAVADDFRGLINSGHMPLHTEEPAPHNGPALTAPYAAPRYALKAVGYDAVIARKTLESLSRTRGYELPWPIPPRKELPALPPLPPAPAGALLPPKSSGGIFGAPLLGESKATPRFSELIDTLLAKDKR